MEFGEVLAMFIVFVGGPWAVFTGIAKVRAAGAAKAVKASGGLRRSELAAMVDDAVAEATAPLRARIEHLEAIITDEDAAAAKRLDAALLDGLERDLDAEDDLVPSVRVRE